MSDRERQQKFAQNSTIKNSEYDRQNTNIVGRTHTDNFGNILPTDFKNTKGVEVKKLVINIVSVVLGILFFIYIVPISKLVVSEKFYSGMLFLFISLLISVFFVYLINFFGKRIFKIK